MTSLPPDAGITLRQLRYLAAVVNHGSFTAASAELHVAQPSLSQQVRLLERAVGGALLERGSQGVRPTPAGVVLLAKARAALNAVGDGIGLARGEIEQPGSIRLVVTPGAPSAIVASGVARWRDRHPGAVVGWQEECDQARVEETIRHSPTVVAVCEPVAAWRGHAVTLSEDPLVLARPIAARAGRDLPLARSGFEHYAPDVGAGAIDVPGPEAALALVRAGAATAVLPHSLLDGDVRFDALTGAPPRRFVALVAEEPTDAARSMLQVLREVVESRHRHGTIVAA